MAKKKGKHIGFKKLVKKLEDKGMAPAAAKATAAKIGRKKYGKAEFQRMAAAGRKHR